MDNNVLTSTMTDGEEQTTRDIQTLQNIKSELFNSLENNLINNNLTNEEQESIINKINEVSIMIKNLYNNLTSQYSFFQNNLSSSKNLLNNQVQAEKIANERLEVLKIQMSEINNNNQNKARLVEINTYYQKQYNAYATVMIYILIICVFIFIVGLFYKFNLLNDKLYSGLLSFILFIGLIFVFKKIYDIYSRDNMNFDEFNWRLTKSQLPTASTSTSSSTTSATTTMPCIGSACCDLTTEVFDAKQNKCIHIPSTNQLEEETNNVSTETFRSL
jgi:uncharacterized membrane protein (DUF485 family)